MFINFWYPTAWSDEVKDEPVHVRLLGQDFVVFRDSKGVAHCLSNVCVHRGGSLAHGRRKDDCVECPYHGWQFDGDGMCRRIPTLAPTDKMPPRAKVDSYPVQEKYGIVFAFLGDLPEEERIPIMPIEEYGGEGWRATTQRWELDINYRRSVENGIDPAHNEFVHPTHGFSGAREDYHLKKREPYNMEWGSGITLGGMAPPLPDRRMREASGRNEIGYIEGGTGHHGVGSIWTHIHPTAEMSIHQYLFEAPIDEYKTVIFLVNMRNFMIEPEHDARMMQRNEYVVFQDRDVLLNLRPVLTPRTNIKENFVRGDETMSYYRDWLKKWEAMGWHIDGDKVKATQDRVAYAIPSPARRHSKGWTLDAIPLAAPHAQAGAEIHSLQGTDERPEAAKVN